MEAMLEAAKRFQDFEGRYLANEAAFQQMQQQFRQMYDNAAQLQSLAEERLASLSNLSVELKARHSQGEQILTEVKALLEEAKACQSRVEQASGAVEKGNQDAAQLAQTLGVVQTLVDKLQTRQANLEQSLLATETLIRDQGKRQGGDDQVTQRQDQLEKALTALEATRQAETNLFSQFEKTVSSLKARVGDLERRPGPKVGGSSGQAAAAVAEWTAKLEEVREQAAKAQELSTQALEKASAAVSAAPTPTGGSNGQAAAAVAEWTAKLEEVREQAAKAQELSTQALEKASAAVSAAAPNGGSGGQPAAAVAEWTAKLEELREQTAKAQELSAQALEKASAAAAAASAAPPPVEGAVAPEEFRKFLARCEEDYKAALELENKLAAQWRKALDGLPSRADGAIQRFLEQNQPRLEQSLAAWMQQREQRGVELENRDEGILSKVFEKQQAMESELAKLSRGSGPGVPPEWTQTIEAVSAAHTNELRFLKTLLWITLAAVGLSYGLVAYAVILRSS